MWTVRDPLFSSLMIGYGPEWNVRYVTAVANPEGSPMAYADVLEVFGAEQKSAGDTHAYTWKTGSPSYYVIAIAPRNASLICP